MPSDNRRHTNELQSVLTALLDAARKQASAHQAAMCSPNKTALEQAQARGAWTAYEAIARHIAEIRHSAPSPYARGIPAPPGEFVEQATHLLKACAELAEAHDDLWGFLTMHFSPAGVQRLLEQQPLLGLLWLNSQVFAAIVREWETHDHAQSVQALKTLTDNIQAIKTTLSAGPAKPGVVQ